MQEIKEFLKNNGFEVISFDTFIEANKMGLVEATIDTDFRQTFSLDIEVKGLECHINKFDVKSIYGCGHATSDTVIEIIKEYISNLPIRYNTTDEIRKELERRKGQYGE